MKLNKIIMAGIALMTVSLASCSDDDVKTPLPTVQGKVTEIAWTTATVEWTPVEGAVQYGYTLATEDGNVFSSGVTRDTFVEIQGLTPNTEYIMNIQAYAAVDGSQSSSQPLVLKINTLAATQLAIPVLKIDVEGRYANVSWPAVANADGYTYELYRDSEIEEEGSMEDATLSFAALDPGNYTLTVTAKSGSDAYTSSEATVVFSIARNEIWRVTGTFTSVLLGASWPVTMIAYSDDSYELVDWYQTYNCSLNFYVDKFDSDAPYKMSSSEYEYDSSTGAYFVNVNRSGLSTVYVYPDNSRFTMSGDKNGGTLVIAVKERNSSLGSAKRDRFDW